MAILWEEHSPITAHQMPDPTLDHWIQDLTVAHQLKTSMDMGALSSIGPMAALWIQDLSTVAP